MQHIKSLIRDFSHLFFPHTCAGCGTDVISTQAVLCIHCIHRLPVTNFHLHADNMVEKIFWGRLPVKQATSFCYFTKGALMQRLLHQLKYNGNKEAGYFMGRLMGENLVQSDRFNNIEALLPLPLYAARERRRGYNQSAVLCHGMAQAMQLPVCQQAVVRIRPTASQTHKNRIDRWKNMEGGFQLQDQDAINGKHVLLVDDVITTGASLEACGHAILQSAATLSIATLAYAVK